MEIKKIFEEGTLSKYLVKNTSYTFMNVLRRTIMIHVPCLAIDTIQMYENDSPIVDEMLANRIGLLPIVTDKTYKKGNSVKMVVDKIGPCTVLGEDVKCSDPKVSIADKKIIITKLGKGRKLKLEMNAIMDCGEKHCKYQPAILSAFPEGVIEEKNGKLSLVDPYNINLHNQHQDLMEKYGIELNYSEKDFILTIETTGQLKTDEIIILAADTLNERLDEFAKEVNKL
jgi:DNA-directed RNA polymerase subunit D